MSHVGEDGVPDLERIVLVARCVERVMVRFPVPDEEELLLVPLHHLGHIHFAGVTLLGGLPWEYRSK